MGFNTETDDWQQIEGTSTISGLKFGRFDTMSAEGTNQISTVHTLVNDEWHWGQLLPEHVTECLGLLLRISWEMGYPVREVALEVINNHLDKVNKELKRMNEVGQ